MEDLWAFNEEDVARAIFECRTPVISAVGHETDTTIADYAADLRAPTPSAAAELAVYDYFQAEHTLENARIRMQRILMQQLQVKRMKLKGFQTRIGYLHPGNQIREHRQRLAECEDRLRVRMQAGLKDARVRLAIDLEKMKSLSPLQRLNQGFSYVEGEAGTAIKSIYQVKEGDRLTVHVTDGRILVRAEEKQEERHG